MDEQDCCSGQESVTHIDVSALKKVRQQVADQLKRLGERQQELADLLKRLGQSEPVAQWQEELAAQQELLEREHEELSRVQAQLEGGAPAYAFKFSDLGGKVTKIVTGVGDTLEEAFSTLKARTNVVMVRVDEETAKALDALVDAGVAKSRSQSAAFLLREGIKAQSALFDRIREKIQAIQKLKEELRATAGQEFQPQPDDD